MGTIAITFHSHWIELKRKQKLQYPHKKATVLEQFDNTEHLIFIVFVFLQGVANVITSITPFRFPFFFLLNKITEKNNDLNRIDLLSIYAMFCGIKVAI